METIRVKILPDGVTAKEVNPLGNRPNIRSAQYQSGGEFSMAYRNTYKYDLNKWQSAESKLRTFSIADMDLPFGDGQDYDEFDVKFAIMQLPVGSIHTAELLPNGKIKIIS